MQDSNLRSGGIYEIFQNDTGLNRYSTSCQLLGHYMNYKFYWGFNASIAETVKNSFPVFTAQVPSHTTFRFYGTRSCFNELVGIGLRIMVLYDHTSDNHIQFIRWNPPLNPLQQQRN